ncbi:two pore domain potassium channel family protein [Streptomyces sp. JJ36]|nr:two pore domain potassium channel family protein [Streptomyces sp. JJ36]
MAVCYFFFPLDRLGTERPVLSWVLFLLALAALTFTLSLQVRYTVTEDPRGRPGLVIPVLVVLSLFVFSSAYYALAQYPGQMRGLTTRLDALYFTLVTTATVGYGDITPHGQEARMVAVVQIVYNFVVLAAAVTSLSGYLRTRIGSPGGRSGGTPRS